MMLGRTIIGTAKCITRTEDSNIHVGQTYRVLDSFEGEDGTMWLKILADDGHAWSYPAALFDWTRTDVSTEHRSQQ
jgi:hypothetical protein